MQPVASSDGLPPAAAVDAQDSGEGHPSARPERKAEEGRGEQQHGQQQQQQAQMFHHQQQQQQQQQQQAQMQQQQQAQMQQAQMQQQGAAHESGLWSGQPPAARHKQWADGAGGVQGQSVQGGNMGSSGSKSSLYVTFKDAH